MLRRTFLGLLGAAGVGAALGKPAQAAGNEHFTGYPESFGVLFDATRCIGCTAARPGAIESTNCRRHPSLSMT